MLEQNVSKICRTVMNFFNKTVDQVDKTVKFVKRESKLSAQLFAKVLIMGCLSDPTISLERLCKLLKESGIKITKQGLHQRFQPVATQLMRTLFTESLKQFKTEKQKILHLLKPFTSVKIQDSSVIALPENLKEVFKGYGGGRASEAGMKLQVMFDYIEGQVNDVTLTEGCRSDQGFDGYIEQLEEGVLYLQDLGYFKLEYFEKAREKAAYFISRYSYPTTLLNEEDEVVDLLKELRKADSFFTKKVKLGKKEKIEVRLVAFRLSDEDVAKRIRKIKEKAQKRGKGSTQATLELAKWSIYITNVAETMLKDEQVHVVYSMRWQIELLFKLCKSEAGLDKVRGKKTDRIVCELYAKLICVVALLYVCFPIRWQANQELSFYKAYKVLKLRALDFFKALQSPYRLLAFIKVFLSDIKDFALKDKYRQKKRLTYQKIMDAADQGSLI
jgi:hypothetical protein